MLAAVLLAWLSVGTIEPLGLHSCPMHGGLSLDGGHSAHQMAHNGAKLPSRSGHSNQCSCPGDCAGPAASVALAPSRVAVPAAVVTFGNPVQARPPVSTGRFAPRLLPFANGPPGTS